MIRTSVDLHELDDTHHVLTERARQLAILAVLAA